MTVSSIHRWCSCAGLLLASTLGSGSARASDNGQDLSPPMGWTSWSSVAAVNEDTVRTNARILASTLKSSGYVYVNVDAGWYLDPDLGVDTYGRWVADSSKFLRGMAALGDYIHGLGLKFGIYVTPGIPATAVQPEHAHQGDAAPRSGHRDHESDADDLRRRHDLLHRLHGAGAIGAAPWSPRVSTPGQPTSIGASCR